MILTPQITHLAHTYPLTQQKHELINNIISQYISGPRDPSIPVTVLSKRREEGGYNITDIPLYAQLVYIKILTTYIRIRLVK